MSINEVMPKGTKPIAGPLDHIVMHGVDDSQPEKTASNDGFFLHLDDRGKILRINQKPKHKGAYRSIPAPADMDLDNPPESVPGMDDVGEFED